MYPQRHGAATTVKKDAMSGKFTFEGGFKDLGGGKTKHSAVGKYMLCFQKKAPPTGLSVPVRGTPHVASPRILSLGTHEAKPGVGTRRGSPLFAPSESRRRLTSPFDLSMLYLSHRGVPPPGRDRSHHHGVSAGGGEVDRTRAGDGCATGHQPQRAPGTVSARQASHQGRGDGGDARSWQVPVGGLESRKARGGVRGSPQALGQGGAHGGEDVRRARGAGRGRAVSAVLSRGTCERPSRLLVFASPRLAAPRGVLRRATPRFGCE